MNPFAVASKSYQVNGAIAYEAQLIAAVVNSRSGIKGRLRYKFEGEGNGLICTVTGTLDGDECEYTTPPIGSITTKNSPLWKSDPQQQLGYFAARSWARRHCPEVILGVYDRDEAEQFRGPDNAKDVTPSVMDRLKAQNAAQEPQGEREGFSRAFIADQTEERSDALTGEIIDNQNTDTADQSPSGHVSVDGETAPASSQEDGGDSQSPTGSSPSSTIRAEENAVLIRYAKDVLPRAAMAETNSAQMTAIEKRWAAELQNLSPLAKDGARAISLSMRRVMEDPANLYGIAEHYADVLGCSAEELGGAA
jgi:hypothetical protein